jgi:acetyltransferase-like isoleucine patch superfamily enzyme
VVVGEGAALSRVISDKRTVIGARCRLGTGKPVPSAEMPQSLCCGAVVLGMDITVPEGARIGRNCIVHPGVAPQALAKPLASGKSLRSSEPKPRKERS